MLPSARLTEIINSPVFEKFVQNSSCFVSLNTVGSSCCPTPVNTEQSHGYTVTVLLVTVTATEGSIMQQQEFVLSFPELREAFEAEAQEVKKARLLLTAAVPVGPDNVRGGYDVPAVARSVSAVEALG